MVTSGDETARIAGLWTPTRKTWRMLRWFGRGCICLGWTCWIAGWVPLSWIPDRFELPLGCPEGIAVDSSGNLYCGSGFYSFVQKYDSSGRYLDRMWVEAAGGAFRLRVTGDTLQVIASRTELLHHFSANGECIRMESGPTELFEAFGYEGQSRRRGPDGAMYEIRGKLLFPRVVRITPSGETSVVVSVPLSRWVLMGPLPAFLFALGGVAIILRVRRVLTPEQAVGDATLDETHRAAGRRNEGPSPD